MNDAAGDYAAAGRILTSDDRCRFIVVAAAHINLFGAGRAMFRRVDRLFVAGSLFRQGLA